MAEKKYDAQDLFVATWFAHELRTKSMSMDASEAEGYDKFMEQAMSKVSQESVAEFEKLFDSATSRRVKSF